MKIFIALFFAIVLIANIELCCFMTLGRQIGILPTLAIIIGTGMLGAWLAKREGGRSWNRIKQSFASGHDPSIEVINGLCILIAGIALCIPGFISDICGLILLLPFVRKPLVHCISKHWHPTSILGGHSTYTVHDDTQYEQHDASSSDDVIDVEANSSSREYEDN